MKIAYGSVTSLYRGYLRETRRLPHIYLQLFFRLKVANDVRAMIRADEAQDAKFNRIRKELRKIHAANNGNHKAFAHILDVAYGRKGKLRWEIMEPLLSHPQALVPPRIIPAVEKSRPPIYSPELKALLTSAHSRTTKPLSPQALNSPPLMPARANPSSEEARLLGRLSKRREVNIRWRYFTVEWKKIRPPLEVVVKDISHDQGSPHIMRPGVRGFVFKDVVFLSKWKTWLGHLFPVPLAIRHVGFDGDIKSFSVDYPFSRILSPRRALVLILCLSRPIPCLPRSDRQPAAWLKWILEILLGLDRRRSE
ncbi:hypothetical protein BD779DRAFT_48542 [Infundibulicybe gibba]|nr:hypothetical protein BD779DRAFT_48542 [Infundibulicybe gibba]